MSVSATVLVLDDCQLDAHGLHVGLYHLPIGALLIQLERVPPSWLLKFNQLHFLKFVKAIPNSDGYLGGSIALVCLEVQEQCYFLYLHFLQELNIDEMRLGSI